MNKSTLTYIGIYKIVIEKKIIKEWLQSDYILLKHPSIRKENIPKRLTKLSKFSSKCFISSLSIFSTISYYIHYFKNTVLFSVLKDYN